MPAEPEPGAWASHAAQPTPRYEIALARAGSRIVSIGGLTNGLVPTNVVEVYDAASDAWSTAPPYPQPAHHLAAVAANAQGEADAADAAIWAFGAWLGLGQGASDMVFRLAPRGATWEPAGTMPRARGAHGAAVLAGEVFLVGGTGASGELLGPVDVLNLTTGQWREAAPLPKPRDHLAVLALDGKLYALGGRERTLASTTNEGFAYDPANDTWSPIASMLAARGGFGAAVWQGRILVAGGEDGSQQRLLASAELYDPARDAWSALPPMAKARTGNLATAWEGRAYVVGGDPDASPFGDAPESFGPALPPRPQARAQTGGPAKATL